MGHSPRGGIDEKTLEIRAAEFSSGDVGDAPMLPELLDQIPPDPPLASVTADAAFDPRKAMTPSPGVPRRSFRPARPPSRGKPDTARAVARNEVLRPSKRFGRTIRHDKAVPTAAAASKYEPGQKTVRGTVFPANGCIV